MYYYYTEEGKILTTHTSYKGLDSYAKYIKYMQISEKKTDKIRSKRLKDLSRYCTKGDS